MSMMRSATSRWPVELIGRNSVTPSTRPSTTALPAVSSALACACSSGVSGSDEAVSPEVAVAEAGADGEVAMASAAAPIRRIRTSSVAPTNTRKPATSTGRARSEVPRGRG